MIEPGPKLDALVYQTVFAWEIDANGRGIERDANGKQINVMLVPRCSTHLNEAWHVMYQMREDVQAKQLFQTIPFWLLPANEAAFCICKAVLLAKGIRIK